MSGNTKNVSPFDHKREKAVEIVYYPHPLLARELKPVRKIDQSLRDTVREMFDLMYQAEGVGLAANQVGLPIQLFVMNPTADPDQPEEEQVFMNPIITRRFGEMRVVNEGCLSFPELRIDVARPEGVEFRAINLKGEIVRNKWKGLRARIVQHESDHLFGISFFKRADISGNINANNALEEMRERYRQALKEGTAVTEAQVDELLARQS